MIRHVLAAAAALTLIAGSALAQPTTTPAQPPAKAAPAKKAPTTPERPPVATKVNLNTANAQQLDALPQIGPARGAWFADPDGNIIGLRQGPPIGAG